MTENKKLVFKFRRYHRLDYVINLLKNKKIILKDNETYNVIDQEILNTPNIENYSKYINENLLNKYICKDCKKENVFRLQKVCEYDNCLSRALYGYGKRRYCSKHKQDDMKIFYRLFNMKIFIIDLKNKILV